MSFYYYFKIKTGDQNHAGTDSQIFVKLYGDRGISNEMRLNQNIKEDAFERNETNIFKVDYEYDCGYIYRIELRSDCGGKKSGWLCDYIMISREQFDAKQTQVSKFTFETGKWITDKNVNVLDVKEGYTFEVPNQKIIYTQLEGGKHYFAKHTKSEIAVSSVLTVDINYNEVNTSSIETSASVEIPISVIKTNFELKISNQVEKTLAYKIGSSQEFKYTVQMDEYATDRVLVEEWIEENYNYNVTMEDTSYKFNVPQARRFAGLKDQNTGESVKCTFV